MPKIILAIETSCDETSASVLKDNLILSNIISSQEFHTIYGGIVPELASRSHIQLIDKITETAIEKARITADNIDIIAATAGPGLIGSLLIGFNYAKGIAATGKKFYGINHIESHLYSPFIGDSKLDFPFISLVVSGGHTLLVKVDDYFEHTILGKTQDDAAGEAFDKGAKMLGLKYPGGPEIDKLAKTGNENFHKFPVTNVRENIYDFSFSGIKTSLLYYLKKNYPDMKEFPLNDICASYQKAIIDTLSGKTMMAAKNFDIKTITVSGGVSLNSKLRSNLMEYEKSGCRIFFPKAEYTTDNAAMIGYMAYLKDKYGSDKSDNYNDNAFARLDYTHFKTLN